MRKFLTESFNPQSSPNNPKKKGSKNYFPIVYYLKRLLFPNFFFFFTAIWGRFGIRGFSLHLKKKKILKGTMNSRSVPKNAKETSSLCNEISSSHLQESYN